MKSIILVTLISVLEVIPMALKGPTFTRYNPCGLGVIQFDKINTDNNVWMVILNLGIYPDLKEPEIEMHFKKPFQFAWANNSTFNLTVGHGYRTLTVKPQGTIAKRYILYMLLYPDNSTPFITEFIMNKRTLCSEIEKEMETNTIEDTEYKDKNSQFQCGRRSMDYTELITLESNAEHGEWPWHVALFIADANNSSNTWYHCGGSIVSKSAIITAGHCVRTYGLNPTTEPNRIVIFAGTADISDKAAPGLQKFVAKEIVMHPSYRDDSPTADVAIIKVENIEFTEYVRPICLWGPSYPYEKKRLFGEYAIMVGFGQTEDDTYSKTLRTTNTLIQSDATCNHYAPNLYPLLLNEFTFCAGFGPNSETNPRNGDSGGGLILGVQQKDERISYFLRGVLSKCGLPDGALSCDPSFYMVYADVAPHYTWLAHHAGITYEY